MQVIYSVIFLTQNIQPKGKYQNWDLINAFINDLQRSRFTIWQTLSKTLSFFPAFYTASEYVL